MGPPSDAPNWLLRKEFLGSEAELKKFRAPSCPLRQYSINEPCQVLVPLLVTILTMAPELRPYSASVLDNTRNSATASIGRMVAGSPNTPASLMAGSFRYPSFMSVPSSRKLLARPRDPFIENVPKDPGESEIWSG